MKEVLKDLIARYRFNRDFRFRVNFYGGTLFNAFYAVFKLATGFYFGSTWLIAVGVFYLTLLLNKYFLVRQDVLVLKKKQAADLLEEWHGYRRTGRLMLLMNIGLGAINVHVFVKNDSFSYPGIIIYAMAFYAFYRLVVVLIRLKNGRRVNSPLFAAAQAVNLSFAVTALFTLQTAMFASFVPGLDVRLPNLLTGTGAVLMISGIAIGMVIKGSRCIRNLRQHMNPGD